MKINDIGRVGYSSFRKQSDARVAPSETKKKVDEVHISSLAKEMLSVQGAYGPERAQKIAELKSSVAAGTYYVDNDQLAERLLPYFKK